MVSGDIYRVRCDSALRSRLRPRKAYCRGNGPGGKGLQAHSHLDSTGGAQGVADGAFDRKDGNQIITTNLA